MNDRLSITEVAKYLGVTPRTIMRWEKGGKIRRSKRDWRGWRFYTKEDLEDIRKFYESVYEYDTQTGSILNVAKTLMIFVLAGSILLAPPMQTPLYAIQETAAPQAGIKETSKSVDIVLDELPVAKQTPLTISEALKYTLGPNDVINIDVRRHPEFSGQYAINSEGKIEYKYIGDIIVSGLTKNELKDRLTGILSDYIIEPEIDIQIVQYLSKVFYVVGDVNRPGKFYMKGDTITVREALIQAGLPNTAASTRKCRLITPNDKGQLLYKNVNAYELLYAGDLRENVDMKAGNVLYIPSTIMAKIVRVISPVTGAISQVTGSAREGAAVAAAAL